MHPSASRLLSASLLESGTASVSFGAPLAHALAAGEPQPAEEGWDISVTELERWRL